MSTKQTAKVQAPWQIPPLGDMARGESQNVQNMAKALESFLYSLAQAMVQNQTALGSPTLARGDMIYKPQSGDAADTRLPVGDDGQFLGLASGLPEWQDLPVNEDAASETTQEQVLKTDKQIAELLLLILMELQKRNANEGVVVE